MTPAIDPTPDESLAREVTATMAPFYQAIGNVAAHWSTLEASLSETLWFLGEIDPHVGACLTAQFLSVRNRLDALMALLDLRGAGKDIREKLEEFGKKCGAVGQKRNRIVHDHIGFRGDVNTPGRLTTIAQKKLVNKNTTPSIEEYQKTISDVLSLLLDWFTLQNEIFAIFPSCDKRHEPIQDFPHPRLGRQD